MSMFTLEEIADRIQSGENHLMLELWERTEKFIRLRAQVYYDATTAPRHFELSDLVQEGYFALCYAAEHYDPGRGAGFLRLLELSLKKSFCAVAGYQSRVQQRDAMHKSIEGDAPTSEDSDISLLESLPAPECYNSVASAEDRIYTEQLHAALEKAIGQLPRKQQDVIRGRYFSGQTGKQIADALGCTCQSVSQTEALAVSALFAVRRLCGLEQFIDARTDFFAPCSASTFNRTLESGVERVVIQRDKMRRRLLKSALSKL